MALGRAARAYKRYPVLARERGWQGTVGVRVEFRADTALPVVLLEQSSGYEVLDRQAIEMLTKALSREPLPAALRGRDFALRLPVEYRLSQTD